MTRNLFLKILKSKYTHLDNDASYCFEREGDTLRIFFEWSNGATDWKNNLNFPSKPYRDMQNKWFAHRGFLKVWKTIEPHLEKEIFDLSVNNIVIAGYSHGAAIAVLCHEYCKFHRPDAVVVGFGYGCPRVLWGFPKKAVKERFNGFTVIRNGRDIVTHLPPAIFGFRHVGAMLEIGKGARYGLIEAHRAENYIKELEKLK